MRDLFAKCGVNCGRCPSFVENLRSVQDRQRCSEGWEKYLNFRLAPEKLIACDGCQALDADKPNRYQNCYVRRCAVKTGAKTCAHCSAYPCRETPSVSLSADARKQITARLGAPIPEADYLAFIELYEGMEHLEAIRASLGPEEIVEKIAVRPARARVVGFPERLATVGDEAAGLAALHQLLERILSAMTDTYARQILLKRRRPHVLGLLWVMGLYGEVEREEPPTLVLDGTVHGQRRECSWLVRKRDNAIHRAVQQAAGLLEDFGVTVQFQPLEANWFLKLYLDDAVGGDQALRALKQYAVALVEKHGEPEYAGSCKLRGEAFVRFSRADMRLADTQPGL